MLGSRRSSHGAPCSSGGFPRRKEATKKGSVKVAADQKPAGTQRLFSRDLDFGSWRSFGDQAGTFRNKETGETQKGRRQGKDDTGTMKKESEEEREKGKERRGEEKRRRREQERGTRINK